MCWVKHKCISWGYTSGQEGLCQEMMWRKTQSHDVFISTQICEGAAFPHGKSMAGCLEEVRATCQASICGSAVTA